MSSWIDRLAGTDPGLTRLWTATRTAVGLLAVMGAEWLLVHFTGALELPANGSAPAPAVAAQHHSIFVIAMLLGGVPAIVGGFAVNDRTARGQLISLLIIPAPVLAALSVGLVLGGHRAWALASFPALMAISGFLRRFGPRGFTTGVLFFIGDFIGFFLHGQFHLGDLGWLAAIVGTAVLTLVLVRFTLFFPNEARILRRSERSYLARARTLAALALQLVDHPTPHLSRRLWRQQVRLNESALIIDAQLDPQAVDRHQRLVDLEVGLANLARFAEALAYAERPAGQRNAVRSGLEAVAAGDARAARYAAAALRRQLPADPVDREDIIALRFAGTLEGLFDTMRGWREPGRDGGGTDTYTAASQLAGGWLPGAANVSAEAATRPGRRRVDRLRLPLYVRSGLQMGVSVGVAVVAGDALSPRRFYWAVLAAFLAFIGTNFAMEQIRKAVHRVLGTVVGVVIGGALVTAVGPNSDVAVVIIVVALWFGIYLFRVSYAFMVIGITVAIAQVYVQLHEYSAALLVLRLEETAIGAAVAVLTVLLVVPVRSRRVVGVAVAEQLEALSGLVGAAVDALRGDDRPWTLHEAARRVDVAYQALFAVTRPLAWSAVGDLSRQTGTTLATALGARNYGRNLVLDVQAAPTGAEGSADRLRRGQECLQASIAALVAACDGDRSGRYVRAASLFERCGRSGGPATGDDLRLVVRDLQLLDGALASLARVWGLEVASLDVVEAPGDRRPEADRGGRSGRPDGDAGRVGTGACAGTTDTRSADPARSADPTRTADPARPAALRSSPPTKLTVVATPAPAAGRTWELSVSLQVGLRSRRRRS